MNRNLIVIVITIFLCMGIGFYFFSKDHSAAPGASLSQSFLNFPIFNSSNPVNSGKPLPLPPAETLSITIAGISREQITVRDFLNASSTVKEPNGNEGYYVIEGNIDPLLPVSKMPEFTIGFYRNDSGFGISLNKEQIGSVRTNAEQALMADLGIDEKTMCNLNYTLALGPGVDPLYDGKNLCFSFCPGATVLPTD